MLYKGSFRCSLSVVLGFTQEVDLLLQQWDTAWAALARAEAKYEISKCQIRPKHKLGRCLCPGVLHESFPPQAACPSCLSCASMLQMQVPASQSTVELAKETWPYQLTAKLP